MIRVLLILVTAAAGGCVSMPVSLTIGYKDASIAATWYPERGGKNPINSGK